MGDSSGGVKNVENVSINFSIDGAQSLELQNALQSNQSVFKCAPCNRTFGSSKGLKIHLGHHKNLTMKINLEKVKRKKGFIKENSIKLNSSGNITEALSDLEEFLNLNREECIK